MKINSVIINISYSITAELEKNANLARILKIV
jgi:hypothetical protein